MSTALATGLLLAGLASLLLAGDRVGRWATGGAGLAVRLCASCVAALGICVVSCQVLAAVGGLNRWSETLLLVGVALAAWRFVPAGETVRWQTPAWPALLVVGVGVTLGTAATLLGADGTSDQFETQRYHVVNAAHWLNGGSLWTLPFSYPGLWTSAFPGNGELLGTFLMLPTHSDAVAYVAPVAGGLLAVLACAVLAAELGAAAWLGALSALALLCSQLFWQSQVDSLMTDLLAAGGVAAAVALGLHAARHHRPRLLLLAGLAAGIAIGAKYTALIPGIVALVGIAALWPRGTRVRRAAALLAAAAVPAAGWYVRNGVATGDPVFPQPLTVAGHTLAVGGTSPLYAQGSTLAAAVRARPAALGDWLDLARQLLGVAGLLVLVGLAGLMLLALTTPRTGGRSDRRTAAALVGIVALVALAAYSVTPFTGGPGVDAMGSNLRYALPGLLLAVAGVAALPWRRAAAVLAALVLLADLPSILRTPASRPGLHLGVLHIAAAVAAGAVAVAVLGAWRFDRLVPHLRASVRSPAAAVLGGLAAAASLGFVLHHADAVASADPLGSVLARAHVRAHGGPAGEVAAIDDADVRALLGSGLDRPLLPVGTTADPAAQPVAGSAQLTARIRELNPAVIVLGPRTAAAMYPSGWTPPPPWVWVGTLDGADVWVRSSGES